MTTFHGGSTMKRLMWFDLGYLYFMGAFSGFAWTGLALSGWDVCLALPAIVCPLAALVFQVNIVRRISKPHIQMNARQARELVAFLQKQLAENEEENETQ